MLAQIMPRTGGDYVFNSRSLHPSVGFAANFSYCFWLAVIYGVYTTYLAAYGFGAFGRMMAGFTGSAGWLDFGDWFSNRARAVHHRHGAVLLSAVVFVVGGLRLFLRLQVGAFVLYMLGAFLLPILAGLFQSRAGFLANFNDYAANLGTDNAARRAGGVGQEGGLRADGFDTEATLKSVTVFWYIFGFLYSSNYFAGEIRMRKRTHLVAIPGARRRGGGGDRADAARPTCTSRATRSTACSASPIPAAYGFAAGAPAYPEIMSIAAGSWVVGAVIIVGFGVGLLIWLPQTMLLISRSMFALVVRPDHARAPVLRRPAHALAGASRSRS